MVLNEGRKRLNMFSPNDMHSRKNIHKELTMQSRLMTDEENKMRKKSSWYRVNFSGPIKNFPTNLNSLAYITTLVIKHNNLKRLPKEVGNLMNLHNLDASHNKLEILPSSIGNMQELRVLILNDNKLSDLPNEMGCLSKLKHLNLKNNPLNKKLQQLYSDGNETNIFQMIRFFMDNLCSMNIKSTPPQRKWRKLNFPTPKAHSISVMSYNILSPHYATPNQYPYCPSWALDWEFRRRRILEEIINYKANIICLQEMDTNQFQQVFKPELEKIGYSGVFLPKSRSRNMLPSEAKNVDGCAIFWDTQKFDKILEFHHEFMLSCADINDNPSSLLMSRIMVRDNVAIGVVFQTKENRSQFCVTTGHIHWHPDQSDVKVIQSIMWTAELYRYIDVFLNFDIDTKKDFLDHEYVYSREKNDRRRYINPNEMPIIMCGDFNSLPDSAAIEFLSNGKIDKSHADFLNLGETYFLDHWNNLDENTLGADCLRHQFSLDRAYREDEGMNITNFTYEFKGLIDYIFYSKTNMRLLGSLDGIPDSWFSEHKVFGCPHVHFPSDHFSLLVELELIPKDIISSNIAIKPTSKELTSSSSSNLVYKKKSMDTHSADSLVDNNIFRHNTLLMQNANTFFA